MKLVIDEKLKHRLVGVAVVLSLGAIFLPAMMKKSSQRLENHFSVKVQLPPKPTTPNVAITNEKEMFETIKVAKVEIPSAPGQKNTVLLKRISFNLLTPRMMQLLLSLKRNQLQNMILQLNLLNWR